MPNITIGLGLRFAYSHFSVLYPPAGMPLDTVCFDFAGGRCGAPVGLAIRPCGPRAERAIEIWCTGRAALRALARHARSGSISDGAAGSTYTCQRILEHHRT